MANEHEGDTRAYNEERFRKIREEKKRIERDEAEAARALGITLIDELKSQHRAEDEAETLYDRLSPAELMHLYENSREEWKRILDAKRAAGERKLIKW